MSDGAGGTSGELQRRIGDTEREAATEALIAHREAGRLDATEFEDRQVQVARSRTWAEVQPLFTDLPQPHPVGMPDVASTALRPFTAAPGGEAVPAVAPVSEGLLGKVVPEPYRSTVMALTPFAALLLFFVTPGHSWLWFLTIPVMAILLYGTDDKDDRKRKDRLAREERRRLDREHRNDG